MNSPRHDDSYVSRFSGYFRVRRTAKGFGGETWRKETFGGFGCRSVCFTAAEVASVRASTHAMQVIYILLSKGLQRWCGLSLWNWLCSHKLCVKTNHSSSQHAEGRKSVRIPGHEAVAVFRYAGRNAGSREMRVCPVWLSCHMGVFMSYSIFTW